MTIRQKLMKRLYPLVLFFEKLRGGSKTVSHTGGAPPVSFYSLPLTLNNGQLLDLQKLKGKKVLLVNTASDCGYTGQYAELQKLYQHAKEDLEIIAFPANDFKEQEKGSDSEIAKFCSVNYGVSFPLARKSVVIKGEEQHPVFQWLTHKEQNGWNDKPPGWNFAKYLVDEEGRLTHCFEPGASPLGNEVLQAVNG